MNVRKKKVNMTTLIDGPYKGNKILMELPYGTTVMEKPFEVYIQERIAQRGKEVEPKFWNVSVYIQKNYKEMILETTYVTSDPLYKCDGTRVVIRPDERGWAASLSKSELL